MLLGLAPARTMSLRSTDDSSQIENGCLVTCCGRTRAALLLLLLFTLANSIACNLLNASKTSRNTVYLNRDLSTGDLSQWTHRDFGLGTDAGSNTSGAGY